MLISAETCDLEAGSFAASFVLGTTTQKDVHVTRLISQAVCGAYKESLVRSSPTH